MDVSRYKYPPVWTPLRALHDAMLAVDEASGKSRGWVVVRRGAGGFRRNRRGLHRKHFAFFSRAARAPRRPSPPPHRPPPARRFRWICGWCPPFIRKFKKEVDKEEEEALAEEQARDLEKWQAAGGGGGGDEEGG